MATQMSRQPFAPLNQSRLQTLCSLKNRQNAISSPSKRKASSYDNDDSENIDPTFSSPKRSKALDGTTTTNPIFKPSRFILTSAPPSPNDQSSVFKPTSLTTPAKARPILNARSPLKTNLVTKTPLSAPAGRSPTRKKVGILNRRRTSGSPNAFTRIDPPTLNGGNPGARGGLPFTIDAALKGTIPSYARRNTTTSSTPRPTPSTPSSQSSASTPSAAPDMSAIPQLYTASPKPSWFFEIHEDTVEEENTNLMYHSTCILDISSDEESTSRIRDLRGKENVPPMDDQSQTSFRPLYQQESAGTALKNRIGRREKDMDACDVDRSPLGEMRAEDFYDEGCDANSAFIVLDDVYEEVEVEVEVSKQDDFIAYQAAAASLLKSQSAAAAFDFSTVPEIRVEEEIEVRAKGKGKGKGKGRSIEELMKINEGVPGLPAAVFQPIEKAEEGWKIWESGSVSGGE